MIAGFALAGLSYGIALVPLVIGQSGHSRSTSYMPLVLPVVGPFVTIDTAHAKGDEVVGLVALGAAQATGYVLGFVSLLMPGERLKRTYSPPKIAVAPGSPGANFGGLSVRASF